METQNRTLLEFYDEACPISRSKNGNTVPWWYRTAKTEETRIMKSYTVSKTGLLNVRNVTLLDEKGDFRAV